MTTNHLPARITRIFVDAGLVALLVSFAVVVLGCSHYLGPDDVQAAQDTEANLNDALAQAQAERPALWTPEQVQRGRVAAGVVAQYKGDH